MFTDKLFTGQREMTGLGIYHYGARFYSPKLGRFLSADTLVPNPSNPQDLNRFSYVRNNPMKYIDYTPIHFFDERIEIIFNTPPVREKSPPCPNGFIWNGQTYRVTESLSEWVDFTRRGKMAKNMRPEHAAAASTRGSLNVGRFYFRVKVDSGQVFDIYYDRAMKNVDSRKGEWFLYRELE